MRFSSVNLHGGLVSHSSIFVVIVLAKALSRATMAWYSWAIPGYLLSPMHREVAIVSAMDWCRFAGLFCLAKLCLPGI